MTKYILIILLGLSLILAVNSCKKDYPKDIPGWLEDKIVEWRKERRQCSSCCEGSCRTVDEYSDGTKTTFWINKGLGPDPGVYDYDGNWICLNDNQGQPSSSCDSTDIYRQVLVRKIWEEKYRVKK